MSKLSAKIFKAVAIPTMTSDIEKKKTNGIVTLAIISYEKCPLFLSSSIIISSQ